MSTTATRAMLSGARKAAILLSVLGEDAAAPILRNLSEEDLERVTEEVVHMGQVPLETTVQVLEEYMELLTEQEHIAVGGQEVDRKSVV